MLWKHVLRHNARAIDSIDAMRVGDADDLPLGVSDQQILVWCERNQRVLVSLDRNTLADHLKSHLASGDHCPGILLVRDVPAEDVIVYLACIAHASDPAEWQDQIYFIP
jgi:hypothetical protein